jgi:Squalene-hopene cyclase C-terminal domain
MSNKFSKTTLLWLMAAGCTIAAVAFTVKKTKLVKHDAVSCTKHTPQAGCVFKTLLGLEAYDTATLHKNKEMVNAALKKGMNWIEKAQGNDGGWGAGSHYNQQVTDPHAVPSDPATTALVAMALLRNDEHSGNSIYAVAFEKGVRYLLNAVEQTPVQATTITQLQNTQPQTKLGRNIDVILTAQFFTNYLQQSKTMVVKKDRLQKALQRCVALIEKAQDTDGGWKDGGWAPVLQSALANNALETARDAGVKVDSNILNKSRDYQKGNFDVNTNNAVTGKAAGVLLYSVSSSARATAKEAQLAEVVVAQAKKAGKLKTEDKVTKENLVKAGMDNASAEKAVAAVKIRGAASVKAQDKNVLAGFGNNGGEEYLSFLMTGESLIISGDKDWVKWYDETTSRLLQIQTDNGSWQGHHCITSPVFCTATCLLILSIDKDIEFFIKTK